MDDDDWRPALTIDSVPAESCSIVYPNYECSVGGAGGQRTSFALSGTATTLDVGVYCQPSAAGNCVAGASLHHVAAVLYGATVTLTDGSSPTISNIGGPLLAGGYLTGTRYASFDSSDNVGIRSSRLYVDDVAQPTTTYSCDFTFTVPCANKTGAELSIDTRGFADGTHSVQVATSDPASNETKSPKQTVTVDNTAPAAPQQLSVVGGSDWRDDDSFSLTWANPAGQVAPIAGARYQICDADGSDCGAPQEASGLDISQLDGVSVPATGAWLVRLWLVDAAGNADPADVASATLRYGSDPDAGSGPNGSTPPTATTPDASSTETTPTPDPTALSIAPKLLLRPGLRITSARHTGKHLVIRGRTASGAAARLTLRFHAGKQLIRRSVRLRGGSFRIVLTMRAKTRRLTASFPQTELFSAQTVSARVR